MPIYDYRCSDCGQVVEVLIRSSSDPVRCPSCDSLKMEKLPSAGHIARSNSAGGHTCCDREERCDAPPCGSQGGGSCCCH
ncbi:MAG: FmdB family zinc ribbon protein [Chloroflexota bacterium]